ncbi:MAG TPA: ABC transporter permease [Spirochaetia bacterium]|nr:MAG: hypothetical protein A2Y41_11145 [Spirochaetes bacterium GWB1_36_13]HCL56677.1 ABC transporter permease [Spirochaetia bacterium]
MWYLALKHLFSRKAQTFLTLIGIIIGSGGYVVFTAIQLGFQSFMVERLINRTGSIFISSRDEYITKNSVEKTFANPSLYHWLKEPSGRKEKSTIMHIKKWEEILRRFPEVVSYSGQLSKEAIIDSGTFSTSVNLNGIDPKRYGKVTNFEEYITKGSLQILSQENNSVLIGEPLMKYLGIKENGIVNLTFSDGKTVPVRIVGTYNTGERGTDNRSVIASISTVQKLTNSIGELSSIILKVEDINQAAAVANKLSLFTPDKVESWDQKNENFLSMTSTQDMVRNITTISFILIVAFGIYNILNMVVNQKKREIAILRSYGYSQKDIIFLFLIQGVILGVIGAFMGLLIGAGLSAKIETIPTAGRGMSHMVVSWDVAIYAKGFLLVVGSSLLASFFPAKNAGKLSPVEIIRGSM